MIVAEVAVLLPVSGTYDYLVPAGWAVVRGQRVWVSFGKRGVEGVVVGVRELAENEPLRLKPLLRLIEGETVDEEVLSLVDWVASYYLAPPGEVLRLALPPGGRATEARRVRLTEEGARSAAGLGQALEPIDLHGLPLRERAVLAALAAAGGEARIEALGRMVEGTRAALGLLMARGLVTQAAEVRARREPTERLVRALRQVTEADYEQEPALRRAPRRQALYRHIATVTASEAAEVGLGALQKLDPRAAVHVRALAEAGLVATRTVRVTAAAPEDPYALALSGGGERPVLTADQEAVLGRLGPALVAGQYTPFVLHGVTGSGKTEVYLHLIEQALALGRGALVLVPEISLTPQLSGRFRGRFGDEVAVLHSGLGDRERFLAWSRLRDGRVRIALGARSAVFAPVARLGVVVVDEEHDSSFKQEEGVRYQARDVALRRARTSGAVAVLGSATPSLEVYEAALAGRMTLLELPRRATPRPLPEVEIIDLRRHQPGPDGLFSAPLVEAIGRTLAAREQAVLFINRRGFATFVLCRACGHRFTCRDCSVTLTYHRQTERLACHYCGYLEPAPSRCPACQTQAVERLGLGTEKVAAIVAERFPGARVVRLDRDTAQGRGIGRVLEQIRSGEADLVVGTQMITKGHDFPGVTLVGVLLADQSMNFPDFRAAERTFQLLAQVAGRAGRGERPGRVVIQTFVPGHAAVVCAEQHDYVRFFTAERDERAGLGYPPFGRLAMVRLDGDDEAAVRSAAEGVAAVLQRAAAVLGEGAEVAIRGPAEAPIARLRGRTRWQLLVRSPDVKALRQLLLAVQPSQTRDVRVTVDVDPVSML
ncbi:MAG TPA: primosomal protein N' [Polyangia bacterium]|jgi:primosomal protein N' (replication factor Y)|nr:primosomal protein N' [Polyangia bacterium]